MSTWCWYSRYNKNQLEAVFLRLAMDLDNHLRASLLAGLMHSPCLEHSLNALNLHRARTQL